MADPTLNLGTKAKRLYSNALADPSADPSLALQAAQEVQRRDDESQAKIAALDSQAKGYRADAEKFGNGSISGGLKYTLLNKDSNANLTKLAPLAAAAALAPFTGGVSLAGASGIIGGTTAAAELGRESGNGESIDPIEALKQGGEQALYNYAGGKALEWGGNAVKAVAGKFAGEGNTVASKAASILTNIDPETIQHAYQRPDQVAAALDGKVDTVGVLNKVRDALGTIQSKAGSEYESAISAMEKTGAGKAPVDLDPVRQELPGILDRFGAKLGQDANGQSFLTFDPLSPITQTRDRRVINEAVQSLLNNPEGDFKTVNMLRRQFGDFIGSVQPGSEASNVLTGLKASINDQLVSQVPGMAAVNAEYAAKKNIIQALSGKFGGQNGEAALNNLLGANKTETRQLFHQLGNETGNDFINELKDIKAAKAFEGLVPKTGSRTTDIIRALVGFGTGGPLGTAAVMTASSPAVVGKATIAAGRLAQNPGAAPLREAAGNAIGSIKEVLSGNSGREIGSAGALVASALNGNNMNENIPDSPSLSSTQISQGQSPLSAPMTRQQYAELIRQDLATTGGRFSGQITAAYQAQDPDTTQSVATANTALDALQGLYSNAGGAKGKIIGGIESVLGKTGMASQGVEAYNEQATAIGQEIISQLYGTGGTADDRDQILKSIPKVTDSKQVAESKIETLRRLLKGRSTSNQLSTPSLNLNQ